MNWPQSRRYFLPVAGAGLLAGVAEMNNRKERTARPAITRAPGPSVVAVVKAKSYSEELAASMLRGIRACGPVLV